MKTIKVNSWIPGRGYVGEYKTLSDEDAEKALEYSNTYLIETVDRTYYIFFDEEKKSYGITDDFNYANMMGIVKFLELPDKY